MFKTIKPPIHLNKYIDCFWCIEDVQYLSHHAIASSKMEILFFSGGVYAKKDEINNGQKTYGARLYGQTTEFDYHFATSQKVNVFAIKFHPNALLGLFKNPANEITGHILDIDILLGNEGSELTEKVLEASTFYEKVDIVSRWLSKKLTPLRRRYMSVENALMKIQNSKNEHSIPRLISEACISQRQFERNFKEVAGFSLREYLKIGRFEKFKEAVLSQNNFSNNRYKEIALELGYYDQAHLNHHFKEFTGIAPKEYFSNVMANVF